MRMKRIMRGSSSTTRMSLASPGSRRLPAEGIVCATARPPLLAHEGNDLFLRLARHDLDEADAMHRHQHALYVGLEIMEVLAVAAAGVHQQDALVAARGQLVNFGEHGVFVLDVD